MNRFDCRPIREAKIDDKESMINVKDLIEPSIDIPIRRHFWNRHDRHEIFDGDDNDRRTSQWFFSEQKYLSGAFSLMDRRKKP